METEIFDDVAAYLVLAPLVIVLILGGLAALWAVRHKPATDKQGRISS